LVTQVNILTAQSACPSTYKVELRDSQFVILEITRSVIIRGGIDTGAKIDWRLPIEVIVCVFAVCKPQINPAESARTNALKEEGVPIA
jgi:hypothetical protein